MASEYFDRMFGGYFKESLGGTSHVTLYDIDATVFEEILRFVYTGEVIITVDNILEVFYASHVYDLAPVKRACLQYIERNIVVIRESMFKLLRYSCLMQVYSLIELSSLYIMKRFDKFCNDDEFLELSFHKLRAIFSQYFKCL